MDPTEKDLSAATRRDEESPENRGAGDSGTAPVQDGAEWGTTDEAWKPGFKLVNFDPPLDPGQPRPVEPESDTGVAPAGIPPLWPRTKAAETQAAEADRGTDGTEWKPEFNFVDFESLPQPEPRPGEIPPLRPRSEAGEAPETEDRPASVETRTEPYSKPWIPEPETLESAAEPVERGIVPPARPGPERRTRPREAVADAKAPAGLQKLGIVGGKGVGKSYLFQAMVYRTYANTQAGSLAYYLDRGGIRLYTALSREDSESPQNIERFIENFSSWNRLPQTLADTQRWFRLRLPYRTGWLGRGRSMLDVEFLDGSGEGFFALEYLEEDYRQLWKDAYLDARIMVFCLPLWVAFPGPDLGAEDRSERNLILRQFEQVIENYRQLRDAHGSGHPVRGILALTMADDRRGALVGLRDRWITPYMDAPRQFLARLRQGSGIAAYLANARRVSEALQSEFDNSHNPRVSGIPNRLDFGGGRPWLIPLSAIDGRKLEHIEGEYPDPDFRRAMDLHPPVPVHVELPLLVALCERENALM